MSRTSLPLTPRATPTEVAEFIIAEADLACDRREFAEAWTLLTTAELVVKSSAVAVPCRDRHWERLVAVHLRLWHLRNGTDNRSATARRPLWRAPEPMIA